MNEPGRLRWRCRRGMAELERLLVFYLDGDYRHAEAAERQVFERLLDMQDAELWRCLTGRTCPEDPALVALTAKIRALDPAKEAAC
ncbi:FAD assembly factor SdhE [Methylococcus geothermalis]|uniref:FAD assembly factor SdhE n=1 Tax=Methylococcus geothermalis TaxID=2681310 RepID=A0A858Q824_9GAMM|nr:succinate dehydrogenase assembly factor 2 [Methylococcus geothermalis]QJD29856.1 succinate dehydrogenase assembly factor 2 [Methylococcus geothermalis]